MKQIVLHRHCEHVVVQVVVVINHILHCRLLIQDYVQMVVLLVFLLQPLVLHHFIQHNIVGDVSDHYLLHHHRVVLFRQQHLLQVSVMHE